MATDETTAPAGGEPASGGSWTRLASGRIAVTLSAPAGALERAELELPADALPPDAARGPEQFRDRLGDLGCLAVRVGARALERWAGRIDLAAAGLDSFLLFPGPVALEGTGALPGGVPFSVRLGLELGPGPALTVTFLEPRVYGASPLAAAALPGAILRGAGALGRVERGALVVDLLEPSLLRALAPLGWKIPRATGVRLVRATATPEGIGLRWSDSEAREEHRDAEQLDAVEGALAFREAEDLLAAGQAAEALEALRSRGDEARHHPFAASRLLSLLAADPFGHDEALELAAAWRRRRPGFPAAWLAEALVLQHRGDGGGAARCLARLAAESAARGERQAALLAAEGCFAAAGAGAPEAVAEAARVALLVAPGHLPALRAQRDLALAAGDAGAAERAMRALADAGDPEAGRAAALLQLGQLLLASDAARGRACLEEASRLAPDDLATLAALARACAEGGEPLRAVRARERAAGLLAALGDEAAAAAEILALGQLWQEALGHADNAALRYREVMARAPGSPAAQEAARRLEALRAVAEGGVPGPDPVQLELELEARAAAAHRAGDAAGEAKALLARAGMARDRGEPDAALQMALAGEAALEAGLAVESEAALRAALAMGLTRDEARAAWAALLRIAQQHRDGSSERAALVELARLAPTGERPALLLRIAALELAAGNLAAARQAAEEARTLAPGDPAAADACLEVARRSGDDAAVATLLGRCAEIEPSRAGSLRLERARLLATLGRMEEAERDLGEAIGHLPPDRALADEHVALRRRSPPPAGALPWSEPLERLADRTSDPSAAARALRDAVEVARAQGDLGGALRAARRVQARFPDPAFASSVLADLLHAGGAVREALPHLRAVLSAPAGADADVDATCRRLRALAELAEDSGEFPLCVAALDRLLSLHSQDADALAWRFRVDPDRDGAAARLLEGARALRSRYRRALVLARAAASLGGGESSGPGGRAAEMLELAREAAAGLPRATAEMAELELAGARARLGASPDAGPALVDALRRSASAREASGDAVGSDALLEESAEQALRSGMPTVAAAAFEGLEMRAVRRDAPGAATALARRSARAWLDGGDATRAERALRRALQHDPADEGAWSDLEALGMGRGDEGIPLLREALESRVTRSQGASRAGALVALARLLRGPGGDAARALAALREAVEASPDDASAASELERALGAAGRYGELGELLLGRAVRMQDPGKRSRLRLRAAGILLDTGDEALRGTATGALEAVVAEAGAGREALLEAAGRLAALGCGEQAAPRLVELCRGDPSDAAASQALARALAHRPRARAEAFQQVAQASPAGATRSGHLRAAADAVEEAGDVLLARELRRAAFQAWPADDDAFRAALTSASGDVDASDAALAERARAVPAEAAGCHRARGDMLLAAGRGVDAARAYEACLAADASDAAALAGLAEARAAAGDGPGALAAARRCVELAAERGDAGMRRQALAAGARIAGQFGDDGEDAATVLEAACRAALAAGDPEADPLLDRAAAALARAGEDLRLRALLAQPACAAQGTRRIRLLWRIGELARVRGDVAAAAEAFGEIASLGPEAAREAPGTSDDWIAAAGALEQAAGADAARPALQVAADVTPDEAAPHAALAGLEERAGDRAAAGRAWLAASLRSDGAAAGRAALAAARLFDEAGLHADAERARAAAAHAQGQPAPDAPRAESDLAPSPAPSPRPLDPPDLPGAITAREPPPPMAPPPPLRPPPLPEASAPAVSPEPPEPPEPPAGVDALPGALAAAMARPTDTAALGALRDLCTALADATPPGRARSALLERGHVAEALLRRAQGEGPPPVAPAVGEIVPPGVRSRAVLPVADGPLARMIALLAPWLEPLFPVDLGRHGVAPGDRLDLASAPDLVAPFELASRALAGRPMALFLGRRPGPSAVLENTQPPSLVLGADFRSLPPGARDFLLARGVALAASGGVLVSRFPPRDLLILLELACRFAGGEPPSMGLPAARAGAFLEALQASVPGSVRTWVAGLAGPAVEELRTLDATAFAAALEETAARVALLHRGDLHGALTALEAVGRSSDLARFALSEPYVELRGMILGWT